MEFKDALKQLRSEIGVSQMELATALHINYTTVSRWETGKTAPSRAMTAALTEYARAHGCSKACLAVLEAAIATVTRDKLGIVGGGLFTPEREAFRALVDDAAVPIYVCDMETDTVLYLNHLAERMAGGTLEELGERKCYDCLMHFDAPCSFCPRERLTAERFTGASILRPFDGMPFRVLCKQIRWNGRDAQICYVLATESVEQLKSIIESINGGVSVVVFEQDGGVRLAYANDRYYTLFGYTEEQFHKELHDPHDTLYPDDAEYAGSMIEQVKRTRQADSFKYRVVKRDGSVITVRCSASMTAIESLGGMVLICVLTDISATDAIERRAIVTGERLKAVLDNIHNGVAATVFDSEGTVQYMFFTDRYCEMLGYTRGQYEHEVISPFDLIVPEQREDVRRQALSMQHIGDAATLRYQALRRDGRRIWLSTDISLMRFAEVEAPVQLCVLTDVTALVEADEALRAKQQQISDILGTTPGGIAVIEVKAREIPESIHTVYYNDRFFSYSGYTREEYDRLLSGDEMHFVFEEDVPSLLDATQRICEGEEGASADTVLRCHTKDGGYRWLLLTGELAQRRGDVCIVNIVMVDVTAMKEAEDKRRISDEMLRIAAETDRRAVILYDVKANVCCVESRSLYSAEYGERIENIPDALIERTVVSQESADEVRSMFERVRAGEEKVTVSLQMQTEPDEYQWFECNATTVFDASGAPDHAVLVFHNITEQRLKEAVFKKWQQSITSRPPESYTLFRCNLSRQSELDEWSGGLLPIAFSERVMTFNERTDAYAEEYVYPEDRAAYIALLNSDMLIAMFYRGEQTATLEYREMTSDGTLRWRLLTVELVTYLHSSDVQAFLMYEDIDEKKQEELLEKERSETDPLTGVLNRVAFSEKVAAYIHCESNAQHALVMLDMDGFKKLNDTFGHAAGDQALVDVTSALRSIIREGDLLCRLGGDEFVMWLRNIPYDAVIEKKAQEICALVQRAYNQDVMLTVSVGIAVYPRDGRDVDSLYRNADKALYDVKQSGKNDFSLFSEGKTADEQPDAGVVSAENGGLPVPMVKYKRRMLIVDDNELSRTLLRLLFEQEYHIETAKNGNDAMIRLRHFGSSIAIVLLDLIMPGMDGLEVLKRMQESEDLRTVPVIVVSACDDAEANLKAIECGAADFVTKPIDPKLIRVRVQSAVSKAENERLRAQNSYLQLQRDEEIKYRTVLESAGMVVVVYDWRTHIFVYDKIISKFLAGDYNGRGLWNVFLSDMVADSHDVKLLQETMLDLANNREKTESSRLVLLKTPSKERHWFRMNVYKQMNAYGLAERMILTFNDVHEEVLSGDRLRYQATRDELTGLYNRTGFIERAAQMIEEHEAGYYAMVSIDIERFKVINDQYGNERGDDVLQRFADALMQLCAPEEGLCCRVMADNFALLIPVNSLNIDEVTGISGSITMLDNLLPQLRFCVGVCTVDDKRLSVSAIYDRAAIAKETVKGHYGTNVAFYDESMRADLLHQQKIISRMKPALEQGQFEVWLQPQFDSARDALIGAEALVRWRSPEDGLISPTDFIPIFERNGFVYEVDKYVWEQVCKNLRIWIDAGHSPVPVSVNISRYDMFCEDLTAVLEGLVNRYELPVELLRLEITESAFAEATGKIVSVVKELIAFGFTVEIDDFGSGYSSLNTLKDVPADILKLDMKFLENTGDSQRSGSIVESVVRMAKWIGMSVIAEGVETKAQAEYLKSIGCNYIQGYFYSRPMPLADYEAFEADSVKQHRMEALNTVENFNSSSFWDANSLDTMVFNHFSGGACIFEYSGEHFEMLRVNDEFAKTIGSPLTSVEILKQRLSAAVKGNEYQAVVDTVKRAFISGKSETCELYITLHSRPGSGEYVRLTVRRIATCEGRYLFYGYLDNITEQRVAEKKEREMASRVNAVLENADGGIYAVCNEDGIPKMIFSNDRYYSQLGYTRAQFEAEVPIYFDVIHPDDKATVGGKIAKLLRDKQALSMEYRCIRRDGSIVHIRSNVVITHIEGIENDVIITVETDISELVAAREEEKRSSQQLQIIMENIDGGVCASVIRDGRSEDLFANRKYYEVLGVTRERYCAEAAGGNCVHVHPDDRARVWADIVAGNGSLQPYSTEFRIVTPDGNVRWINSNTTVLHLPDVKEPVHLSVVADMTERMIAQQAAQASNAKLHAILDNLVSAVYVAKIEGDSVRHEFSNDRFYELTGYAREAYAERFANTFSTIYPEDRARVLDCVQRSVTTGEMISIDYRYTRGDGAVIWLRHRMVTTDIEGIGENVQLSIIDDVTEEKEDAKQMQALVNGIPGGLVRLRISQDGLPQAQLYSDGYLRLVDMSREQLNEVHRQDGALGMIHRDDLPIVKDALERLLKGEELHDILYRLRHGTKGYVWVNAFGSLHAGDTGERFLNVFYSDATEQMEKKSLQLELLDNIPCGAAMYEYDGKELKVLHLNRHYWELVQRAHREYDDVSFIGFVHPDDRGVIASELASALRQGRNFTADIRILCGDDCYRPFRIVGNIVPQQHGVYLIYASYTPLVHKAMSYQQMLPIALSAVMAASTDVSYIKDRDLRYVSCSRMAALMAGLSDASEIAGKSDAELFDRATAERFVEDDRRVMTTGEPLVENSGTFCDADGKELFVYTSKYPLLDSDGNVIGIYGVGRDVTRERETRFELDALLNVIPSGVLKYTADEAEAFAYVSRSFMENLGYTEETFKDKFHNSFREMVWKEDRERAEQEIRTQEGQGGVGKFDYRIEAADGQLRWFHDEGVRITDQNGKAWYYVTLVDITEQKITQEKLRVSAEENRLAIEHSGGIVTKFDISARTLTLPSSLPKLFDLPPVLLNLPEEQIELGRVSPDTADAYRELFNSIMRGSRSGKATFQQNSTKGWRWLEAQYTTVFTSDGKPVSAVITFRDVTEQLEREVVYSKWQQSLVERPENSYTLFRVNLNKNNTYDTKNGTLLEYEAQESDRLSFNDRAQSFAAHYVDKEDREKYIAFVDSDVMLASFYRGVHTGRLEFRCHLEDPKVRWLRLTVELVEYPHSTDVQAYLMYEDVTEQKTAELATLEMAENDPLTGILNRKTFAKRVNEIILNSKPDARHAFLMMDVDGFKLFNDTFGHGAGDEMLIETAHTLRSLLRASDLLGRLGGDEYVIFLGNIKSDDDAGKKASAICSAVRRTYSAELTLSMSVGVALYPKDGTDCDTLYKNADSALYAAKGGGRNGFRFFNGDMAGDMAQRTEKTSTDTANRAQAAPTVRKQRILLVDDNAMEQAMLKNALEKEFTVEQAFDGATALTMIRHFGSAVSAVLLDLVMPGINGLEVLDKMQHSAEMRGIPVIIVSAEDDRSVRFDALRRGAMDYVTKPFNMELLKLRISSAISRAENERLRAQNSFLQYNSEQSDRHQLAVQEAGVSVAQLDCATGKFTYDAATPLSIQGTFDGRGLWQILQTDQPSGRQNAPALQAFAEHFLEDAARGKDSVTVTLDTPEGEAHAFRVQMKKKVGADGAPVWMTLTFIDMDALMQ